ncbi:MAG: hypothetical protein WD066_12025 [Planctomycetaceae bacterium]
MSPSPILRTTLAAALAVGAAGCSCHRDQTYAHVAPPPPLGSLVDPIFQEMEANAEASDFAIPEHEFKGNTAVLNKGGEEHVKQIAVRAAEVPFPIIIQPSSMSFEHEEPDAYEYPIHNDRELDLRRREVVVAALHTMGVHDAEQRVVVAPLLAPGFEGFEAERAYNTGFANPGFYGTGFGTGGLGGFGLGSGIFGGFGGGFGGIGGGGFF